MKTDHSAAAGESPLPLPPFERRAIDAFCRENFPSAVVAHRAHDGRLAITIEINQEADPHCVFSGAAIPLPPERDGFVREALLEVARLVADLQKSTRSQFSGPDTKRSSEINAYALAVAEIIASGVIPGLSTFEALPAAEARQAMPQLALTCKAHGRLLAGLYRSAEFNLKGLGEWRSMRAEEDYDRGAVCLRHLAKKLPAFARMLSSLDPTVAITVRDWNLLKKMAHGLRSAAEAVSKKYQEALERALNQHEHGRWELVEIPGFEDLVLKPLGVPKKKEH